MLELDVNKSVFQNRVRTMEYIFSGLGADDRCSFEMNIYDIIAYLLLKYNKVNSNVEFEINISKLILSDASSTRLVDYNLLNSIKNNTNYGLSFEFRKLLEDLYCINEKIMNISYALNYNVYDEYTKEELSDNYKKCIKEKNELMYNFYKYILSNVINDSFIKNNNSLLENYIKKQNKTYYKFYQKDKFSKKEVIYKDEEKTRIKK